MTNKIILISSNIIPHNMNPIEINPRDFEFWFGFRSGSNGDQSSFCLFDLEIQSMYGQIRPQNPMVSLFTACGGSHRSFANKHSVFVFGCICRFFWPTDWFDMWIHKESSPKCPYAFCKDIWRRWDHLGVSCRGSWNLIEMTNNESTCLGLSMDRQKQIRKKLMWVI